VPASFCIKLSSRKWHGYVREYRIGHARGGLLFFEAMADRDDQEASFCIPAASLESSSREPNGRAEIVEYHYATRSNHIHQAHDFPPLFPFLYVGQAIVSLRRSETSSFRTRPFRCRGLSREREKDFIWNLSICLEFASRFAPV